MDISNILGDYKTFVATILKNIAKKQITIKGSFIDHLGYRVDTLEHYTKTKTLLAPFAKAYTENIHNGREISIYIMKKPLEVTSFEIPMIELPSPRADKPYQTGLEHIEIVVPDYGAFKKRYSTILTDVHNKGRFNELLCLTFSPSLTVKFHPYPLDTVVEHEGNVFINI